MTVPSRRHLFASSTALIAAGALASCAAPSGSTTPASTLQYVMNEIQGILPLFGILAVGLAVAVPALAPIEAAVAPYINAATVAFSTISAATELATAQPTVKTITDNLNTAYTAIQAAITANPALAKYGASVAQIGAVLTALENFAVGVQVVVAAPAMPTNAIGIMPALYIHP